MFNREGVWRALSSAAELDGPYGALYWLNRAREAALLSKCLRSRCGAVIVTPDGRWWKTRGTNGPAGGEPARCPAGDPCCVHAEQRAIVAAGDEDLAGTRLYFARVDAEGKIAPSSDPSCTVCSRLALDAGIAEWCLQHPEGIRVYTAQEYNDLSFSFRRTP